MERDRLLIEALKRLVQTNGRWGFWRNASIARSGPYPQSLSLDRSAAIMDVSPTTRNFASREPTVQGPLRRGSEPDRQNLLAAHGWLR
jgi:hypothetical protein